MMAIVLAGGQSRRMGRDKALIEVNSKPILQLVCEAAAVCSTQILIVTAWRDRYRNIPLPEICEFVYENPDPESTPLRGMALGMAAIASQSRDLNNVWVLVLACDLPNLNGEILKVWGDRLKNLPPEIAAYLPRIKNSTKKLWEPLCGFYRLSGHDHLVAFTQAGGTAVQAWLATMKVEAIALELDDQKMLFNCNSQADLDLLKLPASGSFLPDLIPPPISAQSSNPAPTQSDG